MDGRLIGGRYRLLEPRGEGGTAAVWRAIDERTGRPVAVKLLHPHLGTDPAARERLQREALAMGGIDHPNVVAVRDLILDGNLPALIMDFVEGRSLADAIVETGSQPLADALRVTSEVADGLAAVHAAGLVHRDLKPANILLGTDGRARVADLGIAASADPGEADLTAPDGVAGTLRYLAPERLLGEPATPATDVWGVGVVLVEMLTGAAAFPTTSIQDRVRAAGQGVVRPDGLTDPVWAIIERATADDPAARYGTAQSMAADLRRAGPEPAGGAATDDVDPWADTAVIPVPVAATVPMDDPIPTPSPVVRPAVVQAGPDHRRRRTPLIPILGAAVLALVVAVAALGGSAADGPGGSAAPGAAASAPAATSSVATAAPAPSSPADDGAPPTDRAKPGKGNDKGGDNGKGKDD